MKKLLSLLGISLLALVMAVPAFAAEKPIKVYINGSNVTFTAGSPYLKNNSVLVPFRVVFEKLGLQVLWDVKTGTVTGTGSNLAISLKIGSNRATVNGTVKKLTTAPVSTNGTTYIPLRFIAEATGGTATWDATSRSVTIKTSATSAVADEKAITALIHQANDYYNAEKAISFYSLVDGEQENAESLSDMIDTFDLYDLKNTIESLEILSIQGNEATVYTVESLIRTGGYYVPNERIEYLYNLVRKNGTWKISEMEVQDETYILTKEQGMAPAVIPQSDASIIKDNLAKYYQSMNAENAEGTLAQMTSYGEEYDKASLEDLKDYYSSFNLSYSVNNSNIFYYGSGEAAVYVEATIKDTDENERYEESLIFIFSKSESGAWTIDDSYMLDLK